MSHLRHLVIAMIALLALLIAACSAESSDSGSGSDGDKVTISHAQGETEVVASPDSVVVLDFAILDSLDKLGVGDAVVGLPKSVFPPPLKKYADDKYADVGSSAEPDVEKIAELDPDVILIGGRSAAKYAELAKIAPTIDLSLDGSDYLASFTTIAQNLGELFQKEDAVTAALADIDDAIAKTVEVADGSGTGLLVMVSGGKLSAFGPGSRFGLVHDLLGVAPASTDLKVDSHGQAISFEFVADTNPQWLFVIDRDAAIGQSGASAKEVLDNPLIAGTHAAKNDQIVYLDGARWYVMGSGLGNIVEMIKPIQESLSP